MRDALILALMREAEDGAAKKLNLIAAKLVEKALGGDIQAIKEVCDRVDGRPTQPGSEEEAPQTLTRIERVTFMPPGWTSGFCLNRRKKASHAGGRLFLWNRDQQAGADGKNFSLWHQLFSDRRPQA
jgi:hypothetical protein